MPDYLSKITDYRVVEFYDDKVNGRPEKYREIAEKVISYAKPSNVTVSFHAVSCLVNAESCDERYIDHLPAFILYKPSEKDGQELATLSVNTILEQIGLPTHDEEDDDDEPVHNRSLTDLQLDVHLAFQTAVVNIFNDPSNMQDPIKSQTLRNFLLLLHKTLPVSWPVHALVKDVMINTMYISKKSAYLDTILKRNSPKIETYSKSCSYKADGGFTCGFWALLHAVTVGVVEYNEEASYNSETIATEKAAKIIRDYVEAFGLGNTDIQHVFVKDYDACALDRCNKLSKERGGDLSEWKKLPLWLSEAHSSINSSLMKQKSRRLSYENLIQVQWPPMKLCRKCWQGARWNDDVVFKYLESEYTQKEILDSRTRRDIFGTQFESGMKIGVTKLQQSLVLLLSLGILATRIIAVKRTLFSSSSSKTD
jgi:hypothetical protein